MNGQLGASENEWIGCQWRDRAHGATLKLSTNLARSLTMIHALFELIYIGFN